VQYTKRGVDVDGSRRKQHQLQESGRARVVSGESISISLWCTCVTLENCASEKEKEREEKGMVLVVT
jgi:hypothetical protein